MAAVRQRTPTAAVDAPTFAQPGLASTSTASNDIPQTYASSAYSTEVIDPRVATFSTSNTGFGAPLFSPSTLGDLASLAQSLAQPSIYAPDPLMELYLTGWNTALPEPNLLNHL